MSATNAMPLVAYAVSTAVGSGKTRTAIRYMASTEHCLQNFIYVAPTIKLIDQTADDLRQFIEDEGSDRDVDLIHSKSRQSGGIPVAEEAKATINGANADAGLVVIITTTTFLRIVSGIQAAGDWRVIIDEGFSPVEFLKVHLGARASDGLDHFLKNFSIQPVTHIVGPAYGEVSWVNELAAGVVRRSGEQNATTNALASAVSNPAITCELLMTEKVRSILARTYVEPAGGDREAFRVAPESILTIACYVSPSSLARFGEVLFMSALFEETLLYQMWTKLFGVSFLDHPAFPAGGLRNIHTDQGMHVAVGHLLHEDDLSSKHNLEKSIEDGKASERRPGLRVIDRIVETCAKHFHDTKFLLQTNDVYGYLSGSKTMPTNAIKVPTSSHGLNEFQDYDNVAALAVTNPIPQETKWIMDKTGLSKEQTNMAFRIHTTYQAVGRSSIRKADATTGRKTFLTVGRADAEVLHNIFEGSAWLGQVGELGPLTHVKASGYRNTLGYRTEALIHECLDGLSEDVREVSIRAVKRMAAASEVSKPTWTRAVQAASERSDGWAAVDQKFVRRDAAFYGFTVVEGGYDGSLEDEESALV